MHSASSPAPSPHLRAVGRALPPHYADAGAAHRRVPRALGQEALQPRAAGGSAPRGAGRRPLPGAAPRRVPARWSPSSSATTRGSACAAELGEQAVRQALDKAGLHPEGRRPHLLRHGDRARHAEHRRAAGQPAGLPRRTSSARPSSAWGAWRARRALARAADYLRAYPRPHGAAALGGAVLADAAARGPLHRQHHRLGPVRRRRGVRGAAGRRGGAAAGPRVVATRAVFYPDTERIMGWDMVDSGFKVVLSAKVPELVREHVRARRGRLPRRARARRARTSATGWRTPAAPRCCRPSRSALELPRERAARARGRRCARWATSPRPRCSSCWARCWSPRSPSRGLGAADGDGAGFCAELVLLRW